MRSSRPDRNDNAATPRLSESLQKPSPRDVSHSKDDCCAKETLLSKESCNAKPIAHTTIDAPLSDGSHKAMETSPSSDCSSAGSLPPSPLTVAAVAAHNRHLQTEQWNERRNLSYQSRDGVELRRRFVGNGSLAYHSDAESTAYPLKDTITSCSERQSRIEKWVDTERQQGACSLEDSSHCDASKDGDKGHEGFSDGKAAASFESGTVLTLSEHRFSVTDGGESAKHGEAGSTTENARHSVTDYFNMYPGARPKTYSTSKLKSLQHTTSKLTPQGKLDQAVTPAAKEKTTDERSPPMSSPNSSLTCSASNATQRDYFQGTDLDLSLSTIVEDDVSSVEGLTGASVSSVTGLTGASVSSVTGLTGASVSTTMSLDDRKFRQGVSALDEKIIKVKESLQIWKQKFS